MDEIRKIRFITPPFFFLGNLLLGAWLGKVLPLGQMQGWTIQIFGAIAGVTVAFLLPIGFVIAGVSILLLRVFFRVFSNGHYQIWLTDEAWKRIWPELKLKTDLQPEKSNEVYAGIVFDHEILPKGVHDSNVRLWSAFNISTHSCTALVLSHIVGLLVHIPLTYEWVGTTTCLLVVFVLTAVVTWREHMGMLEFQSHLSRK